jgi:hypothetical protein
MSMKARAATIVAAMIASLFFSANLSAAPEDTEQQTNRNTEQQADTCLTSPRDYTPPGSRWRYRMERSSGRRCWFLKDDVEKTAGKAAEPSAAATEEPAARRKKQATRSLSDARAELSQTPVEPDTRPAPSAPAPAAGAPAVESSRPAKSANMLAPAAATRWPDPMSPANSTASPSAPPAAPADQSAEQRSAPAAPPAAKPQVMPRAVPPMPITEKPLSLPMLITIIAGGLSVLGVLISLLLAWLSGRKARLTPYAPMPPLELSDKPRRPGDLYRERKRLRGRKNGRRAA